MLDFPHLIAIGVGSFCWWRIPRPLHHHEQKILGVRGKADACADTGKVGHTLTMGSGSESLSLTSRMPRRSSRLKQRHQLDLLIGPAISKTNTTVLWCGIRVLSHSVHVFGPWGKSEEPGGIFQKDPHGTALSVHLLAGSLISFQIRPTRWEVSR